MEENKKIYSSAIAYSSIIGLSFLFLKIALKYTDPINILAHRFSIAFISMTLVLFYKKSKLNFSMKNFVSIIPLSLLNPILFFGFQLFGLQYVTSSAAGILQATIPIFTLIFARLILGEKTNSFQKLSLIVSVFGVIYIFYNSGVKVESKSSMGIIFLLVSSISFALYNAIARKKTKEFSVITIGYTLVFSGFIAFNLMSIAHKFTDNKLGDYFLPFTNPAYIVSILYLGILSSVVTLLLSTYVLSKIDASKMSVFGNLGTLITILSGVVFLREKLYFYHIIGALLILVGVIGTNFGSRLSKK